MRILLFVLVTLLISCSSKESKDLIPEKSGPSSMSLGYLEAPAGFEVSVFAEGVTNARQMVMSDSGILYVGSRREGKVYAVVDNNNDFLADSVYTIIEGLRLPNGVAYKDGSLFVAEVSKIWRFDDIDQNYADSPEPVLVTDELPTEGHHGWKYIAFGPDDKLYVPIGAPCNICNHEEDNPLFATLTKMNADGSEHEIVAKGIRNTVGFTWHPETGNIWFTDNGRDWLGDDIPPCELNEITGENQHFGYPYLHGNDVWDPKFGEDGKPMAYRFKKPVQELGAHVAPLGVIFYTGNMFPTSYKNRALIAEHGSWNRSSKVGYQISQVIFDDEGNPTEYKPFITGWLAGEEDIKGRPVSILQLDDGSLLISDDDSGKIYRVTYSI
ncbi:sorbosone dehydrogenase [Balneola sp. EhC07]|uniref:PQQ-dependent sugar dehydrogenase n=1 Tax=Balneola sp. EhC07 TaxID=1849360 RepID=UPI0007F3366F|nr:PQQ-dependent sugar dehydrogenase [Balneola sp. EhC07]OAN60466.1 sorbosone dehydrogenase [Balneola sp. EhC07]